MFETKWQDVSVFLTIGLDLGKMTLLCAEIFEEKKRQQWHMRWFYEISFTSTHWLKKMWVEIHNLGWSRKHSAKIERANRALCQQILCAREQNREHRAPGHALKKGLVTNMSKSYHWYPPLPSKEKNCNILYLTMQMRWPSEWSNSKVELGSD